MYQVLALVNLLPLGSGGHNRMLKVLFILTATIVDAIALTQVKHTAGLDYH